MAETNYNPFERLKYSGAEDLSTDATKLNFHKGTLAEAGGLLRKIGDNEEENKARDFESFKRTYCTYLSI